MRRRSNICVLMILFCLLLTACGRQKTLEAAEAIGKLYAELDSASMQVALEADFGDRVSAFSLQYQYSSEGRSTVEILAPEEVRGVKAHIEAGQTELVFDGLILETGPLPGTGLTPVDALPVMLRTWGHGYVDSTGQETIEDNSCVRVVYKSTVAGTQIEHNVWFSADTYKPVKAEILSDGVRIISCVFETFSMGE